MTDEIKSCPWCGARDAVPVERVGGCGPDVPPWHCVECGACQASGPWRASIEGAVRSWNRPPMAAEVARLRDERDQALRMFAKARHRGPWTLTPAGWVALGRRMAGLPAEPAGGDAGDDDTQQETRTP